MKNITILTALLGFFVTENSYSQKRKPDWESSAMLMKAYYKKKLELADGYIHKWENESTPVKRDTLNDTLLHVYDAFAAFYHPEDVKIRSDDEINYQNNYADAKYYLVKNLLNVYILDTIYKESDTRSYISANPNYQFDSSFKFNKEKFIMSSSLADRINYEYYNYDSTSLLCSIENFRPYFRNSEKKLLSLDEYALLQLLYFLGAEGGNIKRKIFCSVIPRKELKKRLDFLAPYFVINMKSFSRKIQSIYTFPQPICMAFNKDFSQARIDFKLDDDIGFTLLNFDKKTWNVEFTGWMVTSKESVSNETYNNLDKVKRKTEFGFSDCHSQ